MSVEVRIKMHDVFDKENAAPSKTKITILFTSSLLLVQMSGGLRRHMFLSIPHYGHTLQNALL